MKTCLWIACVFLVAVTGRSESPVSVVLGLRDGARIIGVPIEKDLRLKTDVAEMVIPFSRLDSFQPVEATNAFQLTLKNEDRVTGMLPATPMVLQTVLGEIRVPLSELKHGRVGDGGDVGAGPAWSKPVDGIVARLRCEDPRVKLGKRLRVVLEIKNVSDQELSFPHPMFDQSVWHQDRNRGRFDSIILSYRSLAPEPLEQIMMDELRALRAARRDIRLKPGRVATIKLTITVKDELLARLMHDSQMVEINEEMILREHLSWSAGRVGAYALKAKLQRPAQSEDHVSDTVWDKVLMTPELRVEVVQ